jgi:hypothetical protein
MNGKPSAVVAAAALAAAFKKLRRLPPPGRWSVFLLMAPSLC